MVIAAEVHLWNRLVGVVLWNERHGYATFQYAPEFINSGLEIAPLTMPLGSRIYSFPELPKQTFMGLPGLLAEALPDAFGRALLDKWLIAQANRQPGGETLFSGQTKYGSFGVCALTGAPTGYGAYHRNQ